MNRTGLMDPREEQEFAQAFERAPAGQLPIPAAGGGTQLEQNPVGAKHVEVKRNDGEVIAKIKTHAAMAGTDWFYRFPVKKKGGGQDFISGPSVKLANAVARLYGNCQIDVRVVDNGATWLIYAKFIDIETGFALVRPFQQDKGASRMGGTGPEAEARRLDIALQIGVSKATRNVICNALATFCDFAFEEAEKNLVGKIGKNLQDYRERAVKWFEGRKIDLARVEAVVGRTVKDWLAPDLARIVAEVKAVEDGMSTADETWPPPPPAAPNRGDFTKPADSTPPAGGEGGAAAGTKAAAPEVRTGTENGQAGPTPAAGGDSKSEAAGQPDSEQQQAKSWKLADSIVGQEPRRKAILELLDLASTPAEVDAIEAEHKEFLSKLGRNKAETMQAFKDRKTVLEKEGA